MSDLVFRGGLNLSPTAKEEPRRLFFGTYATPALPPPPPVIDWNARVPPPLGMMRNDVMGCCTAAAKGHMIMTASANAGQFVRPTDDDVETVYRRFSPPGTDRGANIEETLKDARKRGFPAAGRTVRLKAFVALEQAILREIRQAVWLFGGAELALLLPNYAVRKGKAVTTSWVERPPAWTMPWNKMPNPSNGHDVNIVGYGPGYFDVHTWGVVKRMGEWFFARYCVEAWGLLWERIWSRAQDGLSPSGFDMQALERDLAIAGQTGRN